MGKTFDISNVSQPKPVNNVKPPVKSWSELLNMQTSSNTTGNTGNSGNSGNINNNNNPHHTNNTNNTNNNNYTHNTNNHSNSSLNSKQLSFASKSISGTNSGCPSRPTSAISLEVDFDSLRVSENGDINFGVVDEEFLMKPLKNLIHSRPIINPGNRCYMIAVLQVLLHTKPFTNYLKRYFFKLEFLSTILSTGKFPLLSTLKEFYSNFSEVNNNSVAVSHEFIDEIFLAFKEKNGSFSSAGFSEQEDAEEFLTALLDALSEEFIEIQSQKLLNFSLPFEGIIKQEHDSNADENDDGDWLQVGPKQRIATTRRTPINQSPIHNLFTGSFQSLYRSPGNRPSITFEPFTILSLSLVKDHDIPIDSITGAIDHVLRLEDLGKKCSKKLSFSTLPSILIIQLKRFIYKSSSSTNNNRNKHSEFELHKITRPLKIPETLQLTQNNSNPATYRLYAFINHHGSSLNAGHYTSIIEIDSENWASFDDDVKIQSVNVGNYLNQNSSAYLIFYERINK